MTKNVNEKIRQFADTRTITYVDCRPEPWAKINACFANVVKKVKRDGGEPQYGWYFVLTRGILITVHHAVWKSPTGKLVDVTPSLGSDLLEGGKVVFVLDDKATPIMLPGCVIGVARPCPLIVPLTQEAKRTARELRRREWEYGATLAIHNRQ